ncbi:MAG: hypothetical protein N4A65_12260 [Cohaesibacter sp.]|jgi:hypothetical protein|nr:hypothetical protein [Cohaesibacter sp.]
MALPPSPENRMESLSNRFCYWRGSKGDAYLFSQIPLQDLANFSNCIVLLAIEQTPTKPQLHWVGEIGTLTPQVFKDLTAQEFAHLGLYVHLLAGGQTEMQKIIGELSVYPDKKSCRLIA